MVALKNKGYKVAAVVGLFMRLMKKSASAVLARSIQDIRTASREPGLF
jgi:hypothetical protein